MDKQSKNVKTFQSDFLIQTKSTPEMERFLMVLNWKSWACLLCGKTDKRWELFIGSANYEARTAVKTENTANKQIVPNTAEKDASPEIKRHYYHHHQQPAATSSKLPPHEGGHEVPVPVVREHRNIQIKRCHPAVCWWSTMFPQWGPAAGLSVSLMSSNW